MRVAVENGMAPVLERVAVGFRVSSESSFEEDGRSTEVTDSALLEPRLAERVYIRCHLALRHAPPARSVDVRGREDARLTGLLREASPVGRYDDDGWAVVGARGASFLVRKNGLTLIASPDEIRGSQPLTADQRVAVRFPTERPYAIPGFYLAIGRAGPPHEGRLKRIYLNASAAAAPEVFGAVVRSLDSLGLRFQSKALNHPAEYARPDAIVAYVEAEDLGTATEALQKAVERGRLAPATPGFALRVSPGIGCADEPRDRGGRLMSLGEHRSKLAAKALIAAWHSGATSPASRADALAMTFRDADVDPASPHLEGCRK